MSLSRILGGTRTTPHHAKCRETWGRVILRRGSAIGTPLPRSWDFLRIFKEGERGGSLEWMGYWDERGGVLLITSGLGGGLATVPCDLIPLELIFWIFEYTIRCKHISQTSHHQPVPFLSRPSLGPSPSICPLQPPSSCSKPNPNPQTPTTPSSGPRANMSPSSSR